MLRYAESERDTSLVICDIGHGCIVSDTIAICNGHKNMNMLLNDMIQGVFFNWYPPKKLKYGKPRLGVSTLT